MTKSVSDSNPRPRRRWGGGTSGGTLFPARGGLRNEAGHRAGPLSRLNSARRRAGMGVSLVDFANRVALHSAERQAVRFMPPFWRSRGGRPPSRAAGPRGPRHGPFGATLSLISFSCLSEPRRSFGNFQFHPPRRCLAPFTDHFLSVFVFFFFPPPSPLPGRGSRFRVAGLIPGEKEESLRRPPTVTCELRAKSCCRTGRGQGPALVQNRLPDPPPPLQPRVLDALGPSAPVVSPTPLSPL